ncbi:conserved hypothetical protein [Beggiatoa sp. PS]|nr:conserved hypothetical protein [Beggiatoa sp. PS]
MHLTRIQIPEFRVLKNVDITFEKDFTPKVFPLGSENGGGKSTLLQLIFVLLHCASHPDKSSFVENMLARYRIPEGVNQQTLAKMDIWDGKKTVQIEFLCCNDDFLQSISNNNNLSFSVLPQEWKIKKQEERNLKKYVELFQKELHKIQKKEISKKEDDQYEKLEKNYQSIISSYPLLSVGIKKLLGCLHIEEYFYLTTYSEKEALLCRFVDFPLDNGEAFLSELSEKVFLVAPSTQVYLFMPEKEKKLIFQVSQQKRASYELALQKNKSRIT